MGILTALKQISDRHRQPVAADRGDSPPDSAQKRPGPEGSTTEVAANATRGPVSLREPAESLRKNTSTDVELALRIGTFLETLPANRSATASEIAEGLFGRAYTLGQVGDCYRCCRAMEEANVLIPGTDGYGYQFRGGKQAEGHNKLSDRQKGPGKAPKDGITRWLAAGGPTRTPSASQGSFASAPLDGDEVIPPWGPAGADTARASGEVKLGVKAAQECPRLPEGVRLLRYEPKIPPVAVDVCTVVVNVDKFIRAYLAELDARLHHPIQIQAGGSVFEILAKLAAVGVEVAVEAYPPSRE